jgi:hypothetical protein
MGTGGSFRGGKWPVREADQSPPSSAEVKNCGAIPPFLYTSSWCGALEIKPTPHSSGSRWLPSAAARVQARVWLCGICGGQSGAGAGFLRVLRFPLPIFIAPIAPQSPSFVIWGWYNRPVVAAVPSGLSPH